MSAQRSLGPGSGQQTVHIDTVALAAAIAGWRALLPRFAAHPQISAHSCEVDLAVSAGLVALKAIHAAMTCERDDAADAHVARHAAASATFTEVDDGNAAMISTAVEQVSI